jgi:hypothetical protein
MLTWIFFSQLLIPIAPASLLESKSGQVFDCYDCYSFKGILGARKFEEEFQRRAKTTLFKITQFQEWVNQLHTGRDTPKSLDIGDIFPNVKMLKDFDAVRALLFNQPINMEKYGMPSERAAPQTFR